MLITPTPNGTKGHQRSPRHQRLSKVTQGYFDISRIDCSLIEILTHLIYHYKNEISNKDESLELFKAIEFIYNVEAVGTNCAQTEAEKRQRTSN